MRKAEFSIPEGAYELTVIFFELTNSLLESKKTLLL